MSETRRTLPYLFATAVGIVVAYNAGKVIGFINGHRRGRSQALGLEGAQNEVLGWGDIDEWQ